MIHQRFRLIFLLVLSVLLIVCTACGTQTAATEEVSAPAEGVSSAEDSAPSPTAKEAVEGKSVTATPKEVSTSAQTIAPTDPPTETPETMDISADNSCVVCHTNQQQLVDTADPILELVSENKGEG